MQNQINNEYFNTISKDLDEETYDLLLYTVNDVLYNYSDHQVGNYYRLKKEFANNAKKIIVKWLRLSIFVKNALVFRKTKSNTIMSNAYVNVHLYGANVVLPPWWLSLNRNVANSLNVFFVIESIQKNIDKRSVKILLSQEFKLLLLKFEKEMLKLFNDYKIGSLIVPNDMSFLENLSIKIAKKNNIPSFVYLHGLPARYNNIDDNRAEYLIVWGNGLKNEYVKAGVDIKKILTLKHPIYSSFEKKVLKSTIDDILVLSKAVVGTPSSSSELILGNRAISLLYLETIKKHLKNLGLEKVKLRLHPSERKEFYDDNLPDDFFFIDESSKEESLSKTSLVIGPTSTMVLDAIKMGKNYILFDPVFDGVSLEGMPLVEPFTGESFIKLSNSFEAIRNNIANPSANIDFDKLHAFFEVNENDVSRFYDITNVKPNFKSSK
jgi:hypothetical protein